jgi:5-methylcytosine-specific restriction endonuclease McrA
MEEITKKKHCERCEQVITARLVRKITTSGTSLIFWECPGGHAISRIPKWISHAEVKKFFDINSIPVVEDFSQDHKCAVCGKTGTEYHHFAPRHLFGDEADKWPGVYLCRPHHTEWHTLVTPNMSGVRHAQH